MAARRLAQSISRTPRVAPGILSEWLFTRPDLISENSCVLHRPEYGSRWPGRGKRVKAGVMLLGVAPASQSFWFSFFVTPYIRREATKFLEVEGENEAALNFPLGKRILFCECLTGFLDVFDKLFKCFAREFALIGSLAY